VFCAVTIFRSTITCSAPGAEPVPIQLGSARGALTRTHAHARTCTHTLIYCVRGTGLDGGCNAPCNVALWQGCHSTLVSLCYWIAGSHSYRSLPYRAPSPRL
jgi:hypothetical protein